LPFCDSRGAIHPQKPDRSAAAGGRPDNLNVAKHVMVVPAILAAVLQGDYAIDLVLRQREIF